MNIDTGELMRLYADQFIPEGFESVPDEFQDEANELLGDKESVLVEVDGDSNLSKWRRQQLSVKERANKKNRRKIAKSSRRKNR